MAIRQLKWIGDPRYVKSDGWRVANWRHENQRVIAIPGFTERHIRKSDDPRLSRSYSWEKDLPGFILNVEALDAAVILEVCPHEFVDVTGIPNPEEIAHPAIILGR